MDMSPQEIDALINATPDTPENAALVQALMNMRAAAQVVKYPFTYTAAFQSAGAANSLAAAATATVNIAIDASAPFLIVSQSYYANTNNAAANRQTTPVPDVVVLLTDTGTGRTLMDQAAPVDAIFGSGQFPYILPEPKLMQANSQLAVQATNRDAAAGFNLYFCFNGYKLFKYGN